VPDVQPQAFSRRYTSRRRVQQAEQTRADVLAAAVALFAERGWTGTTVALIAERAEVAVETVYRGFGSKKELLRQAAQVAVVGDARPVPLAERAEMHPILDGPPGQRSRALARELVTLYRDRRLAAVWAAMLEAAASDPEVAQWCADEEQRRHAMVRTVLEALGCHAAAADVVWLAGGPDSYLKFTGQRGWTPEQWADWVVATIDRVGSPPGAR
jgi:AcrR family transcriptional regulator